MIPAFLLEGNEPNEWFWPLAWQQDLIHQTYRTWRAGCGQGGSPTTSTYSNVTNGNWHYRCHINGDGSYLENQTTHRRRGIHFLPIHEGSPTR